MVLLTPILLRILASTTLALVRLAFPSSLLIRPRRRSLLLRRRRRLRVVVVFV